MDSAQATMFGLDVCLPRSLPFLDGATATATGRRLELSMLATDPEWPADATRISDERTADGGVLFQIEQSELGYRIAGPRYGAALVSPDGSLVGGSPGTGGLVDWQRLLIGQVLPFAAVLHGLEVLHASAVAIDGEAVAFLGPSGAGKTSLALALCRLGADFLADDVLAVERCGDHLLGHPGAPVAGVDSDRVESLQSPASLACGPVLAEDSSEAMVRMKPHANPLPLKAIFVLDRSPQGPPRPRFEPVVAPPVLLAATFNLVLLERRRLEALLDVCALAAAGRVERVVVGPGGDASTLAEELAERIGVGV
jgi:energy-coupling factor transporter ATP-binding protein EcfA2